MKISRNKGEEKCRIWSVRQGIAMSPNTYLSITYYSLSHTPNVLYKDNIVLTNSWEISRSGDDFCNVWVHIQEYLTVWVWVSQMGLETTGIGKSISKMITYSWMGGWFEDQIQLEWLIRRPTYTFHVVWSFHSMVGSGIWERRLLGFEAFSNNSSAIFSWLHVNHIGQLSLWGKLDSTCWGNAILWFKEKPLVIQVTMIYYYSCLFDLGSQLLNPWNLSIEKEWQRYLSLC